MEQISTFADYFRLGQTPSWPLEASQIRFWEVFGGQDGLQDRFFSVQDACFGSTDHLVSILTPFGCNFVRFPGPPNLQKPSKTILKSMVFVYFSFQLQIQKNTFLDRLGAPKSA